jgi:hypothetical protein
MSYSTDFNIATLLLSVNIGFSQLKHAMISKRKMIENEKKVDSKSPASKIRFRNRRGYNAGKGNCEAPVSTVITQTSEQATRFSLSKVTSPIHV